jgi:hypothetical protein
VEPPPRFPRAGGALLAAAILVGVVAGTVVRQTSIGFLAGLGAGLLLILAVWLLDRRRGR